MGIVNFQEVSENIASSGQPNASDFKQIAEKGYNMIINLALMSSDNAILNEGDIVTELGMSYVHIPVQWEHPTLEQFEIFAAVMQKQNGHKVWVHCALNMRVSVFLYLYSLIIRKEPEETCMQRMHRIWQPNEVWSEFVGSVKAELLD